MPTNDPMQKKIQEALEKIQPTEEAKDHMYLEIMRRSALEDIAKREKIQKKPWYLRWQTSAIGTAALAFAIIFTAAIYTRIPQNGDEQVAVIDSENIQTTIVTDETDIPATTTDTDVNDENAWQGQTATTAVTSENSAIETETTTVTRTVYSNGDNSSENSDSFTTTASTNITAAVVAQTTTQTKTTTVTIAKTTTKKTTKATTAITTRTTTQTTRFTSVQTTDTDAKQTESTTTTTQASLTLRQSIFLYYELNWNGVWYDTQYITISSLDISNYLGPAVTEGADVDDTYTVLVYEKII